MGRTRRQTAHQIDSRDRSFQRIQDGSIGHRRADLVGAGRELPQRFNPFSPSNTYYAHYEKIDGLAVSNPVLVNGFKVGQVTQVNLPMKEMARCW